MKNEETRKRSIDGIASQLKQIDDVKFHSTVYGTAIAEFPLEENSSQFIDDGPYVLVKDDTAVLIYKYLEEHYNELPDFEQIKDQFLDLGDSISKEAIRA